MIPFGLKCLAILMLCTLPAFGSVQTDNADGVSPLRYYGRLAFTSPLLIPLHVTSGFGRRFHPVTARFAAHAGTDFAAPMYSKVVVIEDGVIIKRGSDSTSGHYLVVRHKNGWISKYLHLSVFNAQIKQTVEKGDVIGLSGASGRTTGPHLHLEISYQGKALDPALVYFSAAKYAQLSPVKHMQNARLKAEDSAPQKPRIVFIIQNKGKPRVAIKHGTKIVYAHPGDKVFNKFKVVANGKRFSLLPVGK